MGLGSGGGGKYQHPCSPAEAEKKWVMSQCVLVESHLHQVNSGSKSKEENTLNTHIHI